MVPGSEQAGQRLPNEIFNVAATAFCSESMLGGKEGRRGHGDVTGCLASYAVLLFSGILGTRFVVVTAVKCKSGPVLN